MEALRIIAEKRIAQAIEEGSLRTDGWKNKPLPREDDHMVPPELKMAYKILKNSGYMPPELETRKEIYNLEEMISKTEDEQTKLRQLKKLNALIFKLSTQRQGNVNLEGEQDYFRKVVERVRVKGGGQMTDDG